MTMGGCRLLLINKMIHICLIMSRGGRIRPGKDLTVFIVKKLCPECSSRCHSLSLCTLEFSNQVNHLKAHTHNAYHLGRLSENIHGICQNRVSLQFCGYSMKGIKKEEHMLRPPYVALHIYVYLGGQGCVKNDFTLIMS